MASLLLLLSELISHHDQNPDFWATLPSSFSSISFSSSYGAGAAAGTQFRSAGNKLCDRSEDQMLLVQENLHDSRVCVDLVWP